MWCGGERFKFCTACQRVQDRMEAAARREQARELAEIAALQFLEEGMRDGIE